MQLKFFFWTKKKFHLHKEKRKGKTSSQLRPPPFSSWIKAPYSVCGDLTSKFPKSSYENEGGLSSLRRFPGFAPKPKTVLWGGLAYSPGRAFWFGSPNLNLRSELACFRCYAGRSAPDKNISN